MAENINSSKEIVDLNAHTKFNSGKTSEESDIDDKTNYTSIPIGQWSSIEEFTKSGLSDIVEATKCTNAYPHGFSRDTYCSYPTFGRVIDEQSQNILGVISQVLKTFGVRGNIQLRQPDEQFEMLLECNDIIFERLQTNLDELAGIKKNPKALLIESRVSEKPRDKLTNIGMRNENTTVTTTRLISAKNIIRPQAKFRNPIDNSVNKPFMPKLKDKPNSLKPLAILPEYDDHGEIVSYLHPYEFELLKFEVPDSLLTLKDAQIPKDIENTELVYVDTIVKLQEVLKELSCTSKLAIDLENHSYRTFLGITCLLQISTQEKDYILDTLALRDDLHILNEVFTNSKVLKIFHGADLDILWLQRDLSLYVVNMFDTHLAAKSLNFARFSLAYLLKHYCNIEANKTFQLADWRIRPLPNELITYARNDTHYLIYIYERMVNDLLMIGNHQTHLLRSVHDRSTALCRKRFEKPIINSDSHLDMYHKSKKIFDNHQMYALREIFLWRDTIARNDDESYSYVLPNHMMLQIAESLPREMQGILACCNPIPPLVRQHLHMLHQIVRKAREQPLVKPLLELDITRRSILTNVDYSHKLYCPHDLSNEKEFRDDLPTILDFRYDKISGLLNDEKLKSFSNIDEVIKIDMPKPVLSVFDASSDDDLEEKNKFFGRNFLEKKQLLMPFQRYLAVLPMVEKERLEEAARIEAEDNKRRLCPTVNGPLIIDNNTTKQENNNDANKNKIRASPKLKQKRQQSISTINCAENDSAKENLIQSKRIRIELKQNEKINIPLVQTSSSTDKLKFNDIISDTKKQMQISSQNNHPKETMSTVNARRKPSSINERRTCKQVGTDELNKIKRKSRKIKQRLNKGISKKSFQSSNKPISSTFDYKNVDYKRFQGGAQRVQRTTSLKLLWHGKNANKTQYKNVNKLFTFTKITANK